MDARDRTVRASSCPGQCSGHGACLEGSRCACVAGYGGADCGMRLGASASDAELKAAVRARSGL